MNAEQIITQIEELPVAERNKIFAYVDAEIERLNDALDRQAIEEAKRDPTPPVPWEEVKKELGLP